MYLSNYSRLQLGLKVGEIEEPNRIMIRIHRQKDYRFLLMSAISETA